MKDLYIDLKRVNDEERYARKIETYEDVAYRNRVKQRMMEGFACIHPPLFSRKSSDRKPHTPRLVSFDSGNR